jgi:hypothetical protein
MFHDILIQWFSNFFIQKTLNYLPSLKMVCYHTFLKVLGTHLCIVEQILSSTAQVCLQNLQVRLYKYAGLTIFTINQCSIKKGERAVHLPKALIIRG